MVRLSSNIEDIQAYYPVVIVGSGYGGAILASRLARAGQRVCVLERGKEFSPGEFPTTEADVIREGQIHVGLAETPSPHIGSETGLYDVRIGERMNAVVGCGLGGTSLINANVALWP